MSYFIMRNGILFLSIIALSGCQMPWQYFRNNNLADNKEKCPTISTGTLESDKLEKISLNSKGMKKTGEIIAGKDYGYTFTARSGQILKYTVQNDNEVCVWVYSEDNQVIDNPTLPLPKDGQYTLQVGLKKSKQPQTFALEMTLENSQKSVPIAKKSESSERSQENQKSVPIAKKITPVDFVRQHYSDLNQRDYSHTYNNLSSEFKKKNSVTWEEYQQWWEKVAQIKISRINLVEEKEKAAIVKAELAYLLKNGKETQDSKNHIYLIWNEEDKNWQIDQKISPSNMDSGNINQLNQDQAVNVISEYLEAKSQIFGQNFDLSLARKLTTGKKYENIILSTNWLRGVNSYYTYQTSQVQKVLFFDNSTKEPYLKVRIYEVFTRYKSSGKTERKITREIYKFYLVKEDSRWKIYRDQKIN